MGLNMHLPTISDQSDLVDAIFAKLTERAAREVAAVVSYGDEREIAVAFGDARFKLSRQLDLFRAALDRREAQ